MKNKKISQSLKKYHRKKRILERAKTLTAWLFLVIIPSIIILVSLMPRYTTPDTAQYTGFPESEDRTDMRLVNAEIIRNTAHYEDFKWPTYLVNLACCEGWLESDTINDKGNYPATSIDRGIFGINDYWHSEVSDDVAYDVYASARWTMGRINENFQEEWMCDKHIKGKPNYINKCL